MLGVVTGIGEHQARPRPTIAHLRKELSQAAVDLVLEVDQPTDLSVELGRAPVARCHGRLFDALQHGHCRRQSVGGIRGLSEMSPVLRASGQSLFHQSPVPPRLQRNHVGVGRMRAGKSLGDNRLDERCDARFLAANSPVQIERLFERGLDRRRNEKANKASFLGIVGVCPEDV